MVTAGLERGHQNLYCALQKDLKEEQEWDSALPHVLVTGSYHSALSVDVGLS